LAYWSEMRGLTLRLSGEGGATRYVRLTMVERRGLLGAWHNVREARAERAADERGLPSALGEGRMLSWRPLTQRDADELLQQRTRTLERIGYKVIHSSEAERAPWAWLSDLVHRQLARSDEPSLGKESTHENPSTEDPARAKIHPAAPAPEGAAPAPDPGTPPETDEPLTCFAQRLGLEATLFERPRLELLASVDLDALAPLLDELVEHERAELRAVAKRWLELPTLVYELDPAMIERWLEQGRTPARIIAARLPAEGLALCGEGTLRRLQQRSQSPRVRQFAGQWVSRLDA
jgi:hypothetical protein